MHSFCGYFRKFRTAGGMRFTQGLNFLSNPTVKAGAVLTSTFAALCISTLPIQAENHHSSANGNGHQDPLWRSQEKQPVRKKGGDLLLLAGNGNHSLCEAIAQHAGTKLGNVNLKRFADGEVSLQINESLRGKDVYILQPTSPPVNENLMELLLMISTCRRASAKKITAVIPYYGYARQDRKLNSRVPISAADVARLIETMGVDRVMAVDLHCGQIQGFFGPRVPVDNLEAQIIGLDYFERIRNSELEEVVVTDSITLEPKQLSSCKNITQLSIGVLLADAIRRIHQKESLSELFHFIP
eukprot:Platyproteum_vivax@DN5991_c0_g1_i1.p2